MCKKIADIRLLIFSYSKTLIKELFRLLPKVSSRNIYRIDKLIHNLVRTNRQHGFSTKPLILFK